MYADYFTPSYSIHIAAVNSHGAVIAGSIVGAIVVLMCVAGAVVIFIMVLVIWQKWKRK